MILYPAMDLMNGSCVRLNQGKFESAKTYSRDPHQVLAQFAADGGGFVHIVDLDGARDPGGRQITLLSSLLQASQLKVQVGGGVRSLQDVETLLAMGADRVVVGSLCVKNPSLVLEMLSKYGRDRITLALDVTLDSTGVPRVAHSGWQETGAFDLATVVAPFIGDKPLRILVTDVQKDGMLLGPNLELYRSLLGISDKLEVQASGGVSSVADLGQLREAGLGSVIVGKALYEGRFTLKEALAAC